MKKKINQMFVLIALLAILLTTALVTMVYYNLFRNRVIDDLKDSIVLLQEYAGEEQLQGVSAGLETQQIRVTLIARDGHVLYDSKVDSGTMENHSDRPEVIQALETGEGQSMRNSETLSSNTFYYAVRLESGSVLRVAKEAESIYRIFGSVLPSIVCILVVLILFSFLMAHFLTAKLIVPIERLAEDIDNNVDLSDYKELTPFINMIREQHQDIIKNARMRQEFTANVSHELKTPLTSISGYAELIETGMASEADVSRFAQGIHKSASRLLTLINDIIRLSELDSVEQEEPFERLNLYQLADTCVEMLTMNAEKHNVSISISGSDCYINGNKLMIEELLYNLCDNAIRYNNEGGRVEVKVCSQNDVSHETILSVKDTGIGILKEHQERIFERFYRVDKSRSKSTGGTGLGLAIVKHIVAKHGAEMVLESEEGKGTEIRVIFRDGE